MSDPISTVEKDVKAVYTFTKSHIVLCIALAVSLFFGVYMWDSKRADQADQRAQVAQVQAQDAEKRAEAADAANKQFQADAAIKEQAADQRVMQLQTEVDSLAKNMVARNTQLGVQQKTDATMSAMDIAARWMTLMHRTDGIAPTSTGYAVTPEAGIATTQALESVPVLTQNVADLNKTVDLKNQQLSQKDTIITLKGAEASSSAAACESKLAAKDLDIKAANAEVTQVKADAKKKSLKYMIFGGFLVEAIRVGLTHSL